MALICFLWSDDERPKEIHMPDERANRTLLLVRLPGWEGVISGSTWLNRRLSLEVIPVWFFLSEPIMLVLSLLLFRKTKLISKELGVQKRGIFRVAQEKSRNSPGLFSKLVSLVNPAGAVATRVVYSL
jgi:hypothetical protein